MRQNQRLDFCFAGPNRAKQHLSWEGGACDKRTKKPEKIFRKMLLPFPDYNSFAGSFYGSCGFVRTAYEPDNGDIKKVKLSASLKIDKKGDMVLQCFNLYNIPVARAPFSDNPGIKKLAQRTRLQVDQKGRGVFIKLTFMF